MLTARITRQCKSSPQGKFRAGLVQINNSFSGQNYFPYSVGILQVYAQEYLQHPAAYEFLLPLYKRMPIADAVEQVEQRRCRFLQHIRLECPHIAGYRSGTQVPAAEDLDGIWRTPGAQPG